MVSTCCWNNLYNCSFILFLFFYSFILCQFLLSSYHHYFQEYNDVQCQLSGGVSKDKSISLSWKTFFLFSLTSIDDNDAISYVFLSFFFLIFFFCIPLSLIVPPPLSLSLSLSLSLFVKISSSFFLFASYLDGLLCLGLEIAQINGQFSSAEKQKDVSKGN
ncbi:unnamed protein product [Acanthosepion pharaonis]|uniref:Uncharacterized protein n=1 Tax=Acanthosepion pharaonis TaxID=158019 RepID=A0A812BWU3_ACAPH|nr:unnamed protein product [Sepia pharaonis]